RQLTRASQSSYCSVNSATSPRREGNPMLRALITAGLAAACIALAAAFALAARGGTPTAFALLPTATPTATPVLRVALDCDTAAAGIQNACTLASGAATTDVGVV